MKSPKLTAPEKTCDTHLHIIYPEQQFPFQPKSKGTFPPYPFEDYQNVATTLGIERGIVVICPAYGPDNRVVFQAMDDLDLETRAVIALTPEMPDSTFLEAKAKGVVGLATFMIGGRGVIDWPQLPALAAKAADFGLHIDLQMNGRELPDHVDVLKNLPCDLVIDHIGKFSDPPTPVDHPSVQCLFDLIDGGRVYVKLSAAGETSNDTPPYMKDSGRIAQELASRFPDCLFWAANWPHLGNPDPADKPDNADLLDCLLTWAPDETTQRKILAENPGRFYFGEV